MVMFEKVFANPTVKRVIFQLKFSNLFYLEKKIPDLQLDILKEFPESALIIKQPITLFIADKDKSDTDDKKDGQIIQNVWEFKNPNGYTLSISSNSLSIDSYVHKTYDNPACPVRFKDIIEYCLEVFGKHIKLPYVKRIGLRYIDECPINEKTTTEYLSSFNSALSLVKFPFETTEEFQITVVKTVEDCSLIYRESFNRNQPNIVILDFDGYSRDIEYQKCLGTTNKLHRIIADEYQNTIRQPIIDYMEGK